ncbi:TPA: single-stranded DNA-binding protein [Candidatus Poribacteria bacterium]|nr:single-stranded DNA-binding protein [Candidatus Poribacteria bacterium]
MAGYNKVILLGNLTRDPDVRYLPSGTAVASFGIAINRIYNDRQTGEQKKEVCFVDITAFGRTAEICGEYLHKGSPVLVEGRLRYSSWETDDGQRRSKLDVVAQNVRLLPRGVETAEEIPAEETEEIPAEDDIPF